MYHYTVFKEVLTHQDIGVYTSYGITVVNAADGRELLTVSDITTDKDKLTEFAALCEREQPAPIHFFDIIEDFIAY